MTKENIMTPEVKAAFLHVKEHFPSVDCVLYGSDLRWLYLDSHELNAAPDFSGVNIDVSLLEDAVDSLEGSFPKFFTESIIIGRKKIKITNIRYFTDGEMGDSELPQEFIFELEENENPSYVGADLIADKTGSCVLSFSWEEIS